MVLPCPFVMGSVVLHQMQLAILLFDKEEVCCIRAGWLIDFWMVDLSRCSLINLWVSAILAYVWEGLPGRVCDASG